MLAFSDGLNKEISYVDLEPEISKITELKSGIQNNEIIGSEDEILSYFNPLIVKIITWNPVIRKQLETFWKIQRDIIHQLFIKKNVTPYYPVKELNERMKQSNTIYRNTIERIKENDKERVNLYALFFSHVARTEIIEEEIKKHLAENLELVGLDKRTDLNDIFYVSEKIPRKNYMTTDVKAIRDSLSHLKFRIIESGNCWKIHFCNNEHGYNFDKTMTVKEFLKFTYDLEVLFKTLFVLSVILSTISILH